VITDALLNILRVAFIDPIGAILPEWGIDVSGVTDWVDSTLGEWNLVFPLSDAAAAMGYLLAAATIFLPVMVVIWVWRVIAP